MSIRSRALAADVGYVSEEDSSDDSDTDSVDDTPDGPTDNGDPTGVLFEESHITDFWQDVAALHEIVKSLDLPLSTDEFLGYTKDSILSYLRPIVLVDGQHRLRGALAAARQQWSNESIQNEVADRIAEGELEEEVEAEILRREARLLPISLLMSPDPEEQVFQFVVVNQKATPIGRALLGTIVSTTLSSDEISNVATRLKNAGIQVEESQAITYLARHPDSPFRGLVERGLAGDTQDVLKWNVFASLIAIFRTLRGGKLFGERNDYAELWKQKFLSRSEIVAPYEARGFRKPEEYWRRIDGPWRDVFMTFWTEVRDTFGNTREPDNPNYWGRPRRSNLFNKVSLTILAADFFQFLVESRTKLASTDQIPALVEEWLENVNKSYFDRDWLLQKAGVKKDSVGIRNQWASLWSDYRKGRRLPSGQASVRTSQGCVVSSAALGYEVQFLNCALGQDSNNWSSLFLRRLARLDVPAAVFGRQQSLLRADVNTQWATWFVEGVGDPERYSARDLSYTEVFADIFRAICVGFPQYQKIERKELALAVARIVFARAQALQARRRRKTSEGERQHLLDLAGSPPRCWVCGAEFSRRAVHNFLFREREEVRLPDFVDILKPRGLFQSDLSIEIDHVVPHARGGGDGDNLALACGWCNRSKSDSAAIYDTKGRPRLPRKGSGVISSLPQPFWTVRLLATVRTCQHSDGCTRSADNSPVTVAPIARTGAMNPVNLEVTCYRHDTYKSSRLWPRAVVEKTWSPRKGPREPTKH